jgi:hypothetical protein
LDVAQCDLYTLLSPTYNSCHQPSSTGNTTPAAQGLKQLQNVSFLILGFLVASCQPVELGISHKQPTQHFTSLLQLDGGLLTGL